VSNQILPRVVRTPGAVLMGLGSILGTGIFVSIGLAAEAAGSLALLAVGLAAIVATFNGLSSASLAANHPVSGGTYEYGYHYLNPTFGFIAGWMFLAAKSASAATAALAIVGYAARILAPDSGVETALPWIALGVVAAMTLLVASGLKRTNTANTVIVSLTIAALLTLIAAGAVYLFGTEYISPGPSSESPGMLGLFEATALMFVAYTGYGRIATLGEEIHEPRRSIPRAIIITLLVACLLTVSVAAVSLGTLGADGLAAATRDDAAPLIAVANKIDSPAVALLIAIGAFTAMIGVLVNLLLGLSRVVLAMARRGDLPGPLAQIDAGSPRRAVYLVGALIGGLALIGSVKTTWTFSAFTVLIYYAITNLAALRIAAADRLFPRIVPLLGLISCLSLAFFVDATVWGTGLGLIAVGLVWQWVARHLRTKDNG